ncbi:MAG TPA: hypothetical protein VK256_15640 [Candidatus Eisenbacteria bacterium]|nr:hypothetical protein [Candidatus Eisenbacteria bacterium]
MRLLALAALIALTVGCGRAPTATPGTDPSSTPGGPAFTAETASPLPTEIPSPSPVPPPSAAAVAAPPAQPPPGPKAPPACPNLVIASFTAKAEPRAVVLAWTISGGCPDITGSIGGQFAGTMYPGYWVIPVHSSWATYTDHPQKPAGSQQQCNFDLRYSLILSGTAPDGMPPRPAFTEISNVNLC